jgi:hypothetical protein
MDPINCIYKTYNLWERKKILLIKIFSCIVGHNNGTLTINLQLSAILEIQICATLLLVDATSNYHARMAEPPNQSNLCACNHQIRGCSHQMATHGSCCDDPLVKKKKKNVANKKMTRHTATLGCYKLKIDLKFL